MTDIRVPLVTEEYYHVFNRGVARNPVFLSKYDYEQAILALEYYSVIEPPVKLSRFKELPIDVRTDILRDLRKSDKQVEIISFVLMPNHFHFLLRQVADQGISIFMSKFTNSFTRYFNTKHQRVGALFQGVFKAVHVETDEQLIHLSRYIHLNPISSIVIPEKELFTYQWSSLPAYITGRSSIVNTTPILSHFPSQDAYKQFVLDQVDYAKELEKIKHLQIERD